MAENTVPFSIEEAPAPISDDVAVQATPYMDALTIPDTDKPAAFESIVQDYNRVEMDIEKIRGAGLETPEIARYLVENLYKYQDKDGNYQSLPSGYYDNLRESGIPDVDILSTFAKVRDLSPTQQFAEQAAIANTFMAGAMPGATAGAMVAGPIGFVVGGIGGGLAADSYRRMMAPETELPYADKSGAAVAGEIFGGSVPGLSIPWLAKDSVISLGSNFIGENLRRMPFSKPISEGTARAERFLTQGFESARNQPLSYGLSEGRDIVTAAGIGMATEEYARGDRGVGNAALDLAAETGAVLLDPVGLIGRGISNKVPVLRGIVEGLSPEKRVVNAGVRLRKILEEAGENPDELIPMLMAGDGQFAGNDYTALLDEAGIDFSNRTAALQTGVPILYLLESTGLEAQRVKRGVPNEIIPSPELQQRHQTAQRNFNQFLADLIEMDTPESLGLFADLRDQNYRGLMNERLTDAFDRYQNAVNKALEGGETLDTQRVLYNTMFGEDGNGGVFGDIQRQGNILKNLIPKDIDVPAGTLAIPDTEELAGEGLVDVYNRIGEQMSIRGQRPRLSYGKDLVSLDVVLKEFDRYVDPEKYAKKSDVPELPKEEQLDLPGMTVSTPDVEVIEESVSTNELLNFLDAIDQSKKQALRSGNQPLLELLTDIENGAKNTLSAVSNHRNVKTRGGQFSRYFDNYLAYRDEASNVFSNAFLGEMRTGVSPELAGMTLFRGMGNPTLLRLQQMDDAANFLTSYNNRNMGTLEATNEFAQANNLIEAGQEVELIDNGNVPVIRSAQQKVLRGILNEGTYFNQVPVRDSFGELTGETVVETTAAFDNFINDPVTQRILTEYFPEIQADLSDIAKTRTLLETFRNEESLLNKSLESSDAFTTLFRGVYDNPIEVVQAIIGTPGERTMTRANPIQDLSKIARAVASSEDPKVIQGFLDTILNHGYAYSGGGSPINPQTGVNSFSPDKLRQYLFTPMVPGRRTTVVDVLKDTGVLDGGDAHLAKITQVLDEMDKIQQAMSSARSDELGNIANPELVKRVQMQIAEAGVGAFGAGIASNFYGLLARAGIVGGSGSLIASALGARVARDVVTKNPAILAQQLMTEMLKNPRLMGEILEMTKDYKPGVFTKLPTDQLKRMYTFLLGGGLVPAGMSFREFGSNYYGRTLPEERQAQREEAGAAPMVPRGTNPRRVQPTIVPPPQPATPPPQAAAPRPTPPPVAQAPRPAAPAPAAPSSPNQRARYAAMFPNDIASGAIRQGIGSLS